jgi:hypothetical protein
MSIHNIPEELKNLTQWVCAYHNSKMPMIAHAYSPASSTNPKTWTTYQAAVMSVECGNYDHIGFVFNDNGIVGIDIDTGFDEEGLISPLAADIIGKCRSYTEKSKSGRGFHILVKGDIPFKGKNNLNGVEIYKQSRYFIMTGDVLLYDTIIENQEAIDYIIDKYFPTTRESSNTYNFDRIYSPIWDKPQGRIQLRPVYPRIASGSRNICLTSLAGMLHSQGYSPQQILDEISYCNKVACEPMLYERELVSIVNSVTRYKR